MHESLDPFQQQLLDVYSVELLMIVLIILPKANPDY